MAPPANEAVGPQQLPDVCRCAQRCGRARHRTRSELLVMATGRLVAASSRRGCITLAKLPGKQSVHSFLLRVALNSEKAHLSHQPSPCPLTEGQVSGQARGCSSLPTAQTWSARSARSQARHTRYMCSCRDMARWSVQEQEMIPFRTLPSQVTPIGFPDSEPAGLVQRNVSSRLLLELQGRGRQCWPGRTRMPTVRGPQDAFSTRAQSLSKDWEKRRRAGWRAGEAGRTRQNRHKCW